MWILLIVLILFFIFQFLFCKNQVSKTIARQGGMRNKYRRLVELIMALHTSTRIVQEGSDYLTIRASTGSGYTEMQLIQNINHLVIKWETDGNVFGLHKMKWKFEEFDKQDKMMDKINNDISGYLKNVYSAHESKTSQINPLNNEFLKSSGLEYSKLANTLNGINLMLIEICQEFDKDGDAIRFEKNIKILSYILTVGVWDRINKYNWPWETNIIILTMEDNNNTLMNALAYTTANLFKNASLLALEDIVCEIIDKGTEFYIASKLMPEELEEMI